MTHRDDVGIYKEGKSVEKDQGKRKPSAIALI